MTQVSDQECQSSSEEPHCYTNINLLQKWLEMQWDRKQESFLGLQKLSHMQMCGCNCQTHQIEHLRSCRFSLKVKN